MTKVYNRYNGKPLHDGLSLAEILENHKKYLDGRPNGVKADLTGANLTRAKLTRADLTRAKLTRADLEGADLTGADLTRADLTRAKLANTVFSCADTRMFKHDIWGVLAYAPGEVDNLIRAITRGEIDGSCYDGECCCLCGTLEKGIGYEIPVRDYESPAEQWFSMITQGDTPKNNQASAMALEWIQEWQMLVGAHNHAAK